MLAIVLCLHIGKKAMKPKYKMNSCICKKIHLKKIITQVIKENKGYLKIV